MDGADSGARVVNCCFGGSIVKEDWLFLERVVRGVIPTGTAEELLGGGGEEDEGWSWIDFARRRGGILGIYATEEPFCGDSQ